MTSSRGLRNIYIYIYSFSPEIFIHPWNAPFGVNNNSRRTINIIAPNALRLFPAAPIWKKSGSFLSNVYSVRLRGTQAREKRLTEYKQKLSPTRPEKPVRPVLLGRPRLSFSSTLASSSFHSHCFFFLFSSLFIIAFDSRKPYVFMYERPSYTPTRLHIMTHKRISSNEDLSSLPRYEPNDCEYYCWLVLHDIPKRKSKTNTSALSLRRSREKLFLLFDAKRIFRKIFQSV